MSTGHRASYYSYAGGIKTPEELEHMLGVGNTRKMSERPITTDFSHDIPLGFGISVNGDVVYGDRNYVRQIISGQVAVDGLTPEQLVQAHVIHEVIEKAVADGDNPVDVYEGAHPYGEAAEHQYVTGIRGTDAGYEEPLQAALDACYRRDPVDPPVDYWCGPLLDEALLRDTAILKDLAKKGVVDAGKASKRDAGYGYGAERCRDCRHYGGSELAPCAVVAGLVRWDRQCDWWEGVNKKAQPQQTRGPFNHNQEIVQVLAGKNSG